MAFLTPAATGEAAVLRNFITNQFAQVRSTAFGLTDEQLHARSTVSDFTIAALLFPLSVVGWSLLGALVLNLVITFNHNRKRYIAN